ncbi:hypothetical protein, partial [uncultured Succinatimonas sp.]|uniref:hypothetical protein n=1 Tax=uncultured Succinatimonas sp. TaxID=1262973 RepID=UPI0025CDB48D
MASISVLAQNGSTKIFGGKNGVVNSGNGNVLVKSGDISQLTINLMNNLDEKIPENNIYTIGEENGIVLSGSGNTTYEAQNNNYIIGTNNGIYSTGMGSVSLTAGNNNIIGWFENTISKNGIYVESGKVTLDADNENRIKATE